MKLKKIFGGMMAAAALATAAGPVAAQGVATAPVSSPEAAQNNLSRYYPAVQSAITGYFNTHGLRPDQAAKGLVIPWVVTQPVPYAGTDFWGKPAALTDFGAVDHVHGYAVAQGSTVGGCPLFQIKGVDERDIISRAWPARPLQLPRSPIAVCP